MNKEVVIKKTEDTDIKLYIEEAQLEEIEAYLYGEINYYLYRMESGSHYDEKGCEFTRTIDQVIDRIDKLSRIVKSLYEIEWKEGFHNGAKSK